MRFLKRHYARLKARLRRRLDAFSLTAPQRVYLFFALGLGGVMVALAVLLPHLAALRPTKTPSEAAPPLGAEALKPIPPAEYYFFPESLVEQGEDPLLLPQSPAHQFEDQETLKRLFLNEAELETLEKVIQEEIEKEFYR